MIRGPIEPVSPIVQCIIKSDPVKQAKRRQVTLTLRTAELLIKVHSQSYGLSLAIWHHTVSPATRQVNTSRHNPSQRPVLDLPTLEGWNAELTSAAAVRHRLSLTLQFPKLLVQSAASQTLREHQRLFLDLPDRHLYFIHRVVCHSHIINIDRF